MLKKVIGKNIRYLRKQQRLTQRSAALRAGFTPSYWGYLERGEKNPSADVIEKVANTLGVEAHLLLVDHPEKNLPPELIYLLHIINDMGEEHIRFVLTVLKAYLKTNIDTPHG